MLNKPNYTHTQAKAQYFKITFYFLYRSSSMNFYARLFFFFFHISRCYLAKNARRYILLSRVFFKIVILHAMHTISCSLARILVSLYPLHMNNGCTEKYCFALWFYEYIFLFFFRFFRKTFLHNNVSISKRTFTNI